MNKLKEMMDFSGLTMYGLAEKSGITYSTVRKYCIADDLDSMPLGTASNLAKALDTDLNRLYGFFDKKGPELEEGWNEISDHLAVFVENGKLMRGVKSGETVYPYLPAARGGFDNAVGITKERLSDVSWL